MLEIAPSPLCHFVPGNLCWPVPASAKVWWWRRQEGGILKWGGCAEGIPGSRRQGCDLAVIPDPNPFPKQCGVDTGSSARSCATKISGAFLSGTIGTAIALFGVSGKGFSSPHISSPKLVLDRSS